MRKHYIITYEFKGKDYRDYRTSMACSFDAINGDELADQIIDEAKNHALANTKNPIAPNTGVAIIRLIKLADEHTSSVEQEGEVDASS